MSRGKKRSRRNRRETERARAIKLAVVGVVGLAVVALAVFAMARPVAVAAPSESKWTPAPTVTEVIEPKIHLQDVLPRLNETDREFNIVVFGDSTGVSGRGWQVLVPKWLGEKYERRVVLNPWDRDGEQYAAPWSVGEGDEPGITVWNGSSPGRDVQYLRDNEAAIAALPAESVDIVFMNLGHTEKPGVAYNNITKFMLRAHDTYPNAAVVYLKQNPDLTGTPLAANQDATVNSVEAFAKAKGFDSIPVWDAFKAREDVDTLIDVPTMIHPNDAGYQLWADAMIEYITPLLPPG
jgi:hypothetical protein